ncbi:hypothetical protein ACEUW4_01870 [Staphylococcus pseudintermedius]|uniref:hypothetical protein n=2 Tax=Staphylococcus pseudintermedius TaxID=283734 RepID=UPI0018F6B0CA|nr:hypothetical protein [Staphylococcus pseudintermedius]ELH4357426.1 hypothetical protein [Staphylococcus pseudintermedius]MBJ8298055.1 hypothetical protein [Staphylococcus pseudintermedius]MDT0947127.1 hypothetical protein [Staphylococcus pseudintermedius]
MNIKVKKEMNLLELIEYIKKNEIADKVFLNKKGKGKVVVGDDRHLYMTDLNLTDTFTVEVEEVITERTVIPLFLEVYEYDERLRMNLNKNLSIKAVLDESLDDLLYDPRAFHILNDDMTMTLIWKDGEMV